MYYSLVSHPQSFFFVFITLFYLKLCVQQKRNKIVTNQYNTCMFLLCNNVHLWMFLYSATAFGYFTVLKWKSDSCGKDSENILESHCTHIYHFLADK